MTAAVRLRVAEVAAAVVVISTFLPWTVEDDRTLRGVQIGEGQVIDAAMVDGLTRLGEASGEARWTELATSTADVLLEQFLDGERGGFHATGHDAEALVRRPKDLLDNAHPSANSLAAVALLRLGALVGDTRYVDAAEGVLRLLGDTVGGHPTAFGHLLGAVAMYCFYHYFRTESA